MRTESFDTLNTGPLDKVIWTMRTARVRRHMPHGADVVVDLGCGYHAPLLHTLLSHGHASRAIGVDLAMNTSLASESLTLIEGDLNDPIDIPDGHVDVVCSLAVIEHLDRPEVHAREIFRILKPGGILLLTTPSPRGKPVLEFLAYRMGVIDRREIDDHKRYFTGSMLRETLVRAGFASSSVFTNTFQFGLNNMVIAHR